jgi:hypothetical protein
MRTLKLENARYGNLTVIENVNYNGAKKWRCKCDCGITKDIFATNLQNGKSRSCGCSRYPKDVDTPLYRRYVEIHQDCNWRTWKQFKAFMDRMEITNVIKIDTTKPYSPSNVIGEE